MSIDTQNSNSFPSILSGAFTQYPLAPTALPVTGPITSPGFPTVSIVDVPQVIGLVPLFPCCGDVCVDASTCTFGINQGDVVNSVDITIGTTFYGTFTMETADSDLVVQNRIMALIGPAGFIAVVTNNGFGQRNIKITAPFDSCDTFNGIVAKLVVNGSSTYTCNFSGGTTPVTTPSKDCDCRDGLYRADTIPDDRNFVLPVFGDVDSDEDYKNDFNSWLISFPAGYNALSNNVFSLERNINGTWTRVTYLNDTSYGTPYSNNFCGTPVSTSTCTNFNYQGYRIEWRDVLIGLGEGEYRFKAAGSYAANYKFCKVSPPFCLKQWECQITDGTVKFESRYSGGHFGSVTDQGREWSLCCDCSPGNPALTFPILWSDAIRFFGFFGYENATFQRDSIKYQTGIVNKVRDEAIKNFSFRSDKLPLWLHKRFYSYGLMADQLFVSDYNINNADYNLKRFYIVADSDYAPKYNTWSRYMKVIDVKFKEGQQFTYRDRCCS